MELFSSTDITHLPSSMLQIKSANGLDYSSSAGGTPYIDFNLAGSIGYYLAQDLRLSFDYKYSSTDGVVYNLRPQCNMGLSGLIRQINIYSISDGVLLEEVQDNHILCGCLMSHNNGSDKEMKDGSYKKWSLTEGYCGENDTQDITPFTTPNSLPINPTAPNPAGQAYQTQTIQLPFRLSHLLGGEQVIPVGALGGLRIRLILNPPEIFNCLHGDDVDENIKTALTTNITSEKWTIPAGVVGTYPGTPTASYYWITPDAAPLVPNRGNNITIDNGATNIPIPGGGLLNDAAMIAALNTAFDAATLAAGDLVATAGGAAGSFVITNNSTPPIALDLRSSSLLDTAISTAAALPMGTGVATGLAAGASTPDILYSPPSVALTAGAYALDPAFLAVLNAHFDALTTTAGQIIADNITGSASAGYNVDITSGLAAPVGVDVASTMYDGTLLLDIANSAPAVPAGGFAAGITYTIPIMPSVNTASISSINLACSTLYLNNRKDINTCPFKVGQFIQIQRDSGVWSPTSSAITSILPATLPELGIALTFETPWDVGGLVSGRRTARTFLPAFGVINYNLTQMSMNVPVITPPPSYVIALQQAINSEQGMNMDVRAYCLQRSSVIAGQSMAAMNLNGLVAHKAKGILSIPYQVSTGSFASIYAGDNLNYLRGTKYWYEYSGVKHPSRGINSDQTRQGSLSQEQIDQMIKSYEYSLDDKVANLDGFKDSYKHKTFFYGRNLGIFNSVYDAVAGNIQMVIEATSSAGGAAETYTINHYCSAIYNIVMRPDGVVLLK